MLIKSIDILGFKSFADKTTLQFGNGLTAVVGPNGSGKSNVSDAVRWVLGEQSTKNLRGNSMEDVIFNGTATRKPHGYCEVTIHFDNADRSLNFDDDTVSVTRRYYRSHESEYRINGNSVRLRDINELFMDTGLGRDGYSMIGQGKVDAIVSSKSNERRDIFEEAAGISRYRYRKIEAERRLHAADENLLRLNDIMQELKDRVGPLKAQSEKAEKFLELAKDKKELEIGLWLNTLRDSKEAFRNQESKIAIATEQYAEIERELSDFDATIEKNSADFAATTTDIDRLKEQIAFLEEQAVRLNGEINVANTNIAHHEESIARLAKEKQELSLSDDAAAQQVQEKNAVIAAMNEQSEALKQQISAISEELSTLISGSEKVSRKMEEMALQLNEISLSISAAKVESASADTSSAEITARAKELEKLLAEKQTEIAESETEMKALKEDLARCETEISETENTVKGYELRYQSRRASAEKEKEQIDALRLEMQEKLHRANLLTELQNSMEGYPNSVKTVVSESKNGHLSGIYGPVSGLIKVPSEYSVAIEIALAAAAQNIVVGTESDAKKAIQYLKSQNKGRATFLPVSSIKARPLEEKIDENAYGYVGVASDLIRCDDRYKEVMKWLLCRTLVAEDLDSANTIAKKYGYRFKVVSLDGQVVNPGGSLTGGSLAKNVGLLSRADEIEKLQKQAAALEEKIATQQKLYEQSLAAVAAAEAEALSHKSAATTANEDKIRVEAEIRRVSQILAAQKIDLITLQNEQKSGAERLKNFAQSIKTSAEKIKTLEQNRDKIEAEMAQMSDGRNETGSKREELSEKLTALRLQQANLQKDMEQERSAVLSFEQMSLGRGEKTRAIDAELEQIGAAVELLHQSTEALNKQIDAAKESAAEKEKQVENLLAHRTEVEASSAQLRLKEKDKTLQREKINGELERLRAKKDSMAEECENIIKRLYDEYDLTRNEAEQMNIQIENTIEAKKNLAEIKAKIKALGNVNVAAIEEYKEVGERYELMSTQIADVEKTRKELDRLINDLTDQMKTLFMEGFHRIGENFSKIFTDMFGGGHAHLKLTDENDPLQSGIEIIAKLPGKNVPSLEGLSGGEKALIAISIYFAIMQVNAPPFCFLDEVETALDDINVERFANYIKSSKLDTQFICITHRRGTMEAADMLYGVTMQEKGVTRLIELNVKQLEMDLKSLED